MQNLAALRKGKMGSAALPCSHREATGEAALKAARIATRMPTDLQSGRRSRLPAAMCCCHGVRVTTLYLTRGGEQEGF